LSSGPPHFFTPILSAPCQGITGQPVEGQCSQAGDDGLHEQQELRAAQPNPVKWHEKKQNRLDVQCQAVADRGHIGKRQHIAVRGIPQSLIDVPQVHTIGRQGSMAAQRKRSEGEDEGNNQQPEDEIRDLRFARPGCAARTEEI
jgi:hypothetical protein